MAVEVPEEEAQVAAGKWNSPHSPIVDAIARAETGTTGEIRVFLTQRFMEPNAFKRATKLFRAHGLQKTRDRNAVLLYVNLRRRKIAIIGDQGIHVKVGDSYWQTLLTRLQTDLRSMHPEVAIASAVAAIGHTLQAHFPVQAGELNANELSDEILGD